MHDEKNLDNQGTPCNDNNEQREQYSIGHCFIIIIDFLKKKNSEFNFLRAEQYKRKDNKINT